MEKTSTLNLRVNPELNANIVLLPKMPSDINASEMSAEQIHEKLEHGYADYSNGNVYNADDVFEEFRRKHS